MIFYDRPADRQPHAHTMGFCRKERIEDAADIFQIDPGSGVFHREQHRAEFMYFGSHSQKPRTIHHGTHCIDGIHDQVYDYLLQLDTIGWNLWKLFGELALYQDLLTPNFSLQQDDDFANDLVDVLRFLRVAILLEHRADATDHLRRKMTVLDDALQSFTRLMEVGCRPRQPIQTSIAICDDCRQGLVDLVGD